MARMEKYEELKISNQFMFRKVMESNQELCKEMLETIFSKKIERIEYLETEKDMSIRLDDGAYKVFINTKGSVGEITPGLKSLLDFFDGNDPSDDLTRRLEAAVDRARNNKEWRADYMVLNAMRMDDKAEGKAEGIAKEKRERIIYALSRGKTVEQIIEFTGYSREEIERVKDEM